MSEITEPDVIDQVMANPHLVLEDAVLFKSFYAALESAVTKVQADVNTETGRALIASTAFRVVKARTAIEDARKKRTEGWRKAIDKVNGAGKVYRERLEALQDRVKKPLTVWQEKQDALAAQCEAIVAALVNSAKVEFDATADSVQAKIDRIRGINDLVPDVFGDQYEDAVALRDQTLATLTAALERLKKAESDAAELRALRAEQERKDEESRQQAAAAMAEARRREEETRIAQAKAEAAEKAKQEAEARAQVQIEEERRKHQAELDRLAREKRQQEEAEARRQAEEAARQADIAHQRSVNSAIVAALQAAASISADQGKRIVIAIVNGKIPNMRIDY